MKNIFVLLYPLFGIIYNSCGQAGNTTSQKISPSSTRIKVGTSPGSVEVADFNNDHHPDLVITSETDSSITILLGDGKGRFTEAGNSPFFAGNAPNDISIYDFNKDGNTDIALANHERKFITVLIGNGKGAFIPASGSPFPVGGIPHTHGIATGDFNKDGNPDLVTDSWGNDQVEVLFGDKMNLFRSTGKFFKVGKRPYQRVRAGDVNLDGIPDIVTSNTESNNCTILLSDGKGSFSEASGSPFPCGDAPFGLAIGDINGDKKPDLAILNSPYSMGEGRGRNGLSILTGNGNGTFILLKGSPFEAGRIPNRIAIGDVNGDGINDIVSSDNGSDKIYIFIMNRTGTHVQPLPIKAGNHPKGIAIADLNGDGKCEIIVCNQLDNDISIINYR
jgi:hypothetical protein